WTEPNPRDVADPDRRVLANGDHGLLDVAQLLNEPNAADQIFDSIDLEGPRADVEVGSGDGLGDLIEGDLVGPERLGVDVDLVLLHVAADRGDLGHALDRLQGVAHGPILDRSEFVEIPAADDLTGLGIA